MRRSIRKCHRRGHNNTYNQIIVRSDDYTIFELNGNIWLKIPSLIPQKRTAILLSLKRSNKKGSKYIPPSGNLRLILRNDIIEIHYAIEAPKQKPCGTKVLGLDKGYTEVFYGSDGNEYGRGLGNILKICSDKRKLKNQKHNKLFAIARNNPSKNDSIKRNNLGKKKKNVFNRRHKSEVKDIIYNAVHDVFNRANKVVVEDLTKNIKSKTKLSRNTKRQLSSWTKGIIAKALWGISP